MFNNWKARTVLIDYDKIINLEKIQAESFNLAKQDEILARKLILNRVKVKVAKFIEEFKINRIFILGSYYNSYSGPLSPTSCRQLVIEAIMEIVNSNPAIHLLAMCGGLQSIMNAKGIEVVNATDLVSDKEKRRFHSRSTPNPQQEDIPLQQVRIIPNSRLAKVVAKFLLPDENGWFLTYFLGAYSGAINNTLENRKKLELLGYKVVAFSNDGIIEAIEDKHGNICFRGHLEILTVKPNRNLYLLNHKARHVPTLVVIAIVSDFLYRD
ncbi:glutamine amidotransferase [Wolbachia endosymbiont of Dirofilaria (Dirofilaria) immitis]|nr:glutamine amidotransferase [Wolbachia endosymbiont of Dirofilaria (Dirofilaria) immitis]